MICDNCKKQEKPEQLELPVGSKTIAEFNMNWAKYRDGQRSMLQAIVSYLENTGHPGVAKRVKDKFS